MIPVQLFNTIIGSAFSSGINLYLTVALLGLMQRFNVFQLPGDLTMLGKTPIIIAAIVAYLIEFVADKVPAVDSIWDSVHTFIRPIGAAAISYYGMQDQSQVWQLAATVLAGGVALESHLAKASSRMAINTSPEPVSNSIASVAEDGIVAFLIFLIAKYPLVAFGVIILMIILGFLIIKIFFKLLKKIFSKKAVNSEM